MKRFFIPIDTEGDNLWAWREGDPICTENAKFLPRFQSLCEEYGFRPDYLTNYEMASDNFFRDFAGNKQAQGPRCLPESTRGQPISLSIQKTSWRKRSPS